ncbi:MAG: ABC transporter substrate-binding protein [Candidatus Thorarchaeota archaeon]
MASGELEKGRNIKTIAIAIVVIAIIGVGAVLVVLNMGPSQDEGITLTILTRHDTAIHTVYEEAFLASDIAEEYGITDLKWKTQAAQFWDDVIEAGGIDVLWGGGPTLFDQMQRDEYLETLTSEYMLEVVDRVPDSIAGADMKRRNEQDEVIWVAAAISSFGFTVNHNFLDDHDLPMPNNWTHLAKPVWGSLLPTATIAMGNAPKTTSNTRIYEIITQGMGWDDGWATMARMAGSARLYQGSVETQAAAENGDVGVSMSIDFYGYTTQANNPDCEYILPEGESIVNGDPIAIVENSEHMNASEAFLDYVLSAEGQSLWLSEGIRRMPVLESAFHTELGQENEGLYSLFNQTLENEGIDFNETLSVNINTAFTAYFEAVFNDAHDSLADAWKALVDAYYDEEITREQLDQLAAQMGEPVTVTVDGEDHKFTIPYAEEINEDMIYDSSFYNSMQQLWRDAAENQYDQVISDLNDLIGS